MKQGLLAEQVRLFFTPPEYPEDGEKTRQARLLHALLAGSILLLVAGILIEFPLWFAEKNINTVLLVAALAIVCLSYGIMRGGRVRIAGILFTYGMWAVLTPMIFLVGGLLSIASTFYIVLAVIAGILLGIRGALQFSALCCATGFGLALLEVNGVLPARNFPIPPFIAWMDLTAVLIMTTLTMRFAIRDLNNALGSTRRRLEELKRAEEALRESEERYARMSSAAFEGIAIVDQGRILDANPQLAKMLGIELLEMIESDLTQFVDPESVEMVRENIRTGSEGPYEYLARRKDGTVFPAVARSRVIPYLGGQERVIVIRDITERKRAEVALRASEEKFRRFFETARDCVFITDAQGRVREANPAAESLWGYTKSEYAEKPMYELFVDARDLACIQEQIEQKGYAENFEIKGKRKDGTLIDLIVSATIILDEQGNITGYQGSAKDISGHKRTEENTARQMRRLSALHNIEQAITSSMDLQTVLGMLAREVVGQLHMDAVSLLLVDESGHTLKFAAREGFRTDALQFTRLDFGKGLAGQAAQTRRVVHIPDLSEYHGNPTLVDSLAGEEFTAYFGIPLIAKGHLSGVMEIFRRSPFLVEEDWTTYLETLAGQAAIAIENARLLDMTQANLKETEALYHINQGLVALTDPAQLMMDVVTLLQKNCGYYYVQVFLREPGSGDFVVRAGSGAIGKKMVRQGYRIAAGEGIIGYTAETGVPFVTNNVEEIIFNENNPLLAGVKSELAVPIQVRREFLGLLEVYQVPPATLTRHDVEMVSAVAGQLAVALQKAQLYADLQNSLRQEKETRAQLIHIEKLAVTGRLMASVSHELNNPLQAIQNALFLLKDEATLSRQAKQDLGVVISETERMAAMLDRLRTTYQPVRFKDFSPVRINDILKDVYALVATHLRQAGITFELQVDPALPPVMGVRDQLQQVVLNLFMNAVDAMPGGGRLSVTTETMEADGEIRIDVSDTGEGIDPAILPQIFEPFISSKEKGTGLGLTICSEIIANHNGRILAGNKAEGGAMFRVWLPAVKEGKP